MTNGFAENETIHDNLGINTGNTMTLGIVANYNDKKITVTLKRVSEFDFTNLIALPEDSKQRIAKNGETLYLVKSSIASKRKVNYGVVISPNIPSSQISSQDITWYYPKPNTQYNLGQNYGNRNEFLTLTKDLENDFNVKVKAGNPNQKEKNVNVKWVDGSITAFSFVPPAVSSVLTQKMEDIEGVLKYSNRFFDAAGVKFELESIKITGSKFNAEDIKSRLYRYIEKGDVSGGLKVEWKPKKPITIPQFAFLSRAGIADVGITPSISLSFKAKGGVERYKFVEKIDFEDNNPFLELSSAGCIDVSLGAELLVARDLVEFNIYGGAKGCLQGKIIYNFGSEDFSGRVSIPPVVLYSGIKIKSKGSVLNFTLVDWSGSISITDEILLYP